ncbi:Flagellar hook-length control protein FliK [Collimonas arenae]|uniref:Flagellar hook-length control protein FliK n=1 Tax=Collimonas arenae TaxID=279058 RepID=A0A0A1F734_9BURK|nr:flagellar hook-length control protein FliK [Collimonas arenae]AIY40291.1 Flagellar hook-length control protein FliK [Collimonas arenae]
MSLLVSANTAALQAGPSASGNNASQQQGDAGNFGQVLNRSLASSDKPVDATDSAAKPIERSAPKRAAASDKDNEQQDAGALPVLAFMPLPPAAVSPLQVRAAIGSDSQPSSAAEKQLNAAIAAAGGKAGETAAAPVATQPATEGTDKDVTTATAAAVPMAALASASAPDAAQPTRAATTGKEPGIEVATVPAHNSALELKGTMTGNNAGQQAAHDEGFTDKHGTTDKPGRPENRSVQEFAARHMDIAPTTGSAARDSNGSTHANPMTPDMSGQVNPAAANSHSLATTTLSIPTQAAPARLALTPSVGSDGWAPALGKQMVWLGNSGHQSAELHLNPPDLGPLKVTLTINDNQAQAMFVSAHQSVRSALEAALPQLRSSLADSGINLGNTSVSADTQQQSAFAQSQSQHQSGQHGPSGQFQRNAGNLDLNPRVERNATLATVSRNGNGKVDIFA